MQTSLFQTFSSQATQKIGRSLPRILQAIVWGSACNFAMAFAASPVFSNDAHWADLRIQFIYDAPEPPPRKRIAPLDGENCIPESLMPLSEVLIVDPETMGIENIVLYLDPKNRSITKNDIHPDLRRPPAEPSVLDARGCAFEPHVFISQAGQKLRLMNSDQFGHNPNFNFFANDLETRMHPPGHTVELEFSKSEKAPSPIHCNIHPWMRAYVLVFDHPYTGISDRQGVLKIEKLPAGVPIDFKVWHESMEKSIDQVTLQDEPTLWPKGIVRWTLQPGMNDMGVVKIKPEIFKR
jgi:hypothetical protein